MAVDLRFRPLAWTGPVTPAGERRSRHAFKAGWSATLELLEQELRHLEAKDIVLEVGLAESDIRIDGWPRANAKAPPFPGVRLWFSSKHGPLVYFTDTYVFWQHNVRAIALGLQALRAVDRYGVTRTGEQYTGWKAIENVAAPLTNTEWASLALLAGVTVAEARHDPGFAYRRAARYTHPDTSPGKNAEWLWLQSIEKRIR